MTRVTRIVGSFLAVLAAYGVYALVATPFIEPAPESPAAATRSTEEQRALARNRVDRELKTLRRWFHDGDWELDQPKVIETAQGRLLLRDYQNLPDGTVKISPCTLILAPREGVADAGEHWREAVIVRAPEGAILQFDGPFDLGQAKVSKLIGGKLVGPITIVSDQKRPGPEDDLRITGRDVLLQGERIVSPHPIEFRLGPSHGAGQGLVIELQSEPGRSSRHGLNVTGLKSFALQSDVRMHVETPPRDPSGDRPATPQAPLGLSHANAPVEIASQGPFRFDLVEYVATFEDHVDVVRLLPTGPSDQLSCELLWLYFAPAAPAAPAKSGVAAKSGGDKLPKLEPRRIVAEGKPVIVRSPVNLVEARGRKLEYDIRTRKISLLDDEQVWLRQGPNEIRAPAVEFQPDDTRRWGTFFARGPGQIRGALPDDPRKTFEAHWTKSLSGRPLDREQLISLEGQARVVMTGLGGLDAERMHVWLRENALSKSPSAPIAFAPPPNAGPAKPPALVPDRLLAEGGVRIDSQPLVGAVATLQVWFQHEPPTANSSAASPAARPVAAAPIPGLAAAPPTTNNNLAALADPSAPGGPVPAQRFSLSGRLVQAQLRLRGRAVELIDLNMQDAVKLTEIQTAQPDDKPLVISGETVQLTQPTPEQSQMAVAGKPAHVEGRGLELEGDVIHLHRGKNRLWIDGPGRMRIPFEAQSLSALSIPAPSISPADQREAGVRGGSPRGGNSFPAQPAIAAGGPTGSAPVAAPSGGARSPLPLDVTWQGRMLFDGREATFEKSIEGQVEHRLLRTEVLRVGLTREVDFAATRATGPRPEVATVACSGGVYLENHEFDARGPTAFDKFALRDITINQQTGEISGSGPGWLTSTRLGSPASDSPLAPLNKTAVAPAGQRVAFQAPADPTPPESAARQPRLQFLNVRFENGLSGNLTQRRLTFHGQVRALHGPVADWAQTVSLEEIDRPGSRAMALSADALTATQMPGEAPDTTSVELEATGNVVVEGMSFTARGRRATFAQAKDLIVLEGDGRTDAEISRQEFVGAAPKKAAARKIMYWRDGNRVQVEDARYLDINQIPAGR